MPESAVLERRDGRGSTPITLVDADVHAGVGLGDDNWTTRLSQRAQDEFHGLGGRAFRFWGTRNRRWGGGARGDSVPQEGESELDLVRRQLLDEYDVDYGVMSSFNALQHAAPWLAAEGARAMNDTAFETCMEPEPRLLGSICVPWEQPELAVREIELRAGDRRWVQVMAPSEAVEPLGARKYWPIYEAATAFGLPVATHIGGYAPDPGTGWQSYDFEAHLGLSHSQRRQLLSMVCEGLFHAVPGVRIMLVEGGVAWASSLRWALDSAFELLGHEVRLDRRPSEYLDEFVYFTTQPIEEPDDPLDLMRAIEHGHLAGRLLFSSDYPHWDFDSPSQALPRRIPAELREQIMAGNGCALYGLPR